ncbi:probable serine hydrolase [Cloeon dipterum]|uniref:probable serine hydrolase n=1 Tax=Cloeon dipterum TaxID=197152 RepID=UPI0032201BA1
MMRSLARNVLHRAYSSVASNFKEVKIPVPWGHVAGKWWGPQEKQPVIALHGWQENCCTYDPLMRALPSDVSVLALDMPGNGQSPKFTSHGAFHYMEDVIALRAVINQLKFKDKIKFMCHSYSFSIGFMYAVLYPKEVDRELVIEKLKPDAMVPEFLIKHGSKNLDKLVDVYIEEKNKEGTIEEHAAHYRKSAMNSMSLDNAKLLMERSAVLNPDTGLYVIKRDPRGKYNVYFSFPNEFYIEISKNYHCKTLYITGSKGLAFESKKIIKEVLDVIEKNAEVEFVTVEGSHHVHMENPHLVTPHVLRFLFEREDQKCAVSQ